MIDLIHKGELFNALANANDKGEIFAIIQNAQTVAAVVREKGEWIPLKDMVKGDTIYHCSKCWTKTGKRRRKRYNFCPNCGADMRGK